MLTTSLFINIRNLHKLFDIQDRMDLPPYYRVRDGWALLIWFFINIVMATLLIVSFVTQADRRAKRKESQAESQLETRELVSVVDCEEKSNNDYIDCTKDAAENEVEVGDSKSSTSFSTPLMVSKSDYVTGFQKERHNRGIIFYIYCRFQAIYANCMGSRGRDWIWPLIFLIPQAQFHNMGRHRVYSARCCGLDLEMPRGIY